VVVVVVATAITTECKKLNIDPVQRAVFFRAEKAEKK